MMTQVKGIIFPLALAFVAISCSATPTSSREPTFAEGMDAYNDGDCHRATRIFEQLANRYSGAAVNLGNAYRFGECVERDTKRAYSLLNKACMSGDLDGCYNLGAMFKNGEYVERDYEMAFHLWRKAAESGHAGAMNGIGLLYSDGLGTEQSLEEAIQWYKEAATLGDPTAMYNLFFSYAKESPLRDGDKAKYWVEKAADAGSPPAYHVLVTCYQHGAFGFNKDEEKARYWQSRYDKAVSKGLWPNKALNKDAH